MQTYCRGNLQRRQVSLFRLEAVEYWYGLIHITQYPAQVGTGYSLGWEVSVGRLQVDLRGSRSSGPICPSMSLFKIIQLVLYRERDRCRETEIERWKELMDDGKVWVSKLVNGCTVFIDLKKMTWKETWTNRWRHVHILTHLAIIPILPRCSRSCKTVTCYRMSQLMCWIMTSSAADSI